MKTMKWTGAGALLWLVASPAFAVICDDTDDDRYMQFTPIGGGSATCFLSGSTPPSEGNVHTGEPYNFTEIEKIDASDEDDGSTTVTGDVITSITGLGGTSGTVNFLGTTYELYEEIFVTFKYGSGGLDPDWFTYRIVDVFEADWQVNQSQALSHITLYGNGGFTEVPGPAPLALLGLGLLGMTVVVGRRRG